MKKFLTVLVMLVFCAVGLQAAFALSSSTMTQVGTTLVWYKSLQNPSGRLLGYYRYASLPGDKIVVDINYTKGDETSINFKYGVAYKLSYATAPVLADYSYVSTGVAAVAQDVRTITGTSRWTFEINVPDRASHFFIEFGNTGGTPTGTIVVNAYVRRYTGGKG